MTNSLIQQLETLPAFSGFKKALSEKLNLENNYVSHFEPESDGYYDDKDENGKQQVSYFHKNSDEREEEAVCELLSDNSGYFNEFVTEDLSRDAIELIRVLIKEIIKQERGYHV